MCFCEDLHRTTNAPVIHFLLDCNECFQYSRLFVVEMNAKRKLNLAFDIDGQNCGEALQPSLRGPRRKHLHENKKCHETRLQTLSEADYPIAHRLRVAESGRKSVAVWDWDGPRAVDVVCKRIIEVLNEG